MSSSGIDSKKAAMVSDSSKSESLFFTKTPDKTAILSTRSRDREIAISSPEIKRQVSRDPNVQIKSVKRQILTSPRKPKIAVKLPEMLEILEGFFNAMDTAIRLLKLKRSLTTFANICPKIEYITDRIFSYDHLAQMMHIYPEAIEVKRVLKYDEGTSCMKPSLHINLNTDIIVLDDTTCGTKYMELRKKFHSKLVEFHKAHSKDEIPKELLPEPFNSGTIRVDVGESKLEVKGFDVEMEEMEQEQELVNNVIPDSTLVNNIIRVDVGESKLEVKGFDVEMEETNQEQDLVNNVIPDSTLSDGTEKCLHTESKIIGTPVKDLFTPSKDLSTPIRLMSATPTLLRPSRRCITMTPDDVNVSVISTNGLEKRPSRTRCLNFNTLEEDEIVEDDISNYEADDASDEDSLLHSMKEKPEAELKNQNLRKLVNLIHKLFHSTNRAIITKEELLYKMITSQINITDRQEVEEQLSLMLQLVPDWISETKASSGDFLVRINKMSTAEAVRARLEQSTFPPPSTEK